MKKFGVVHKDTTIEFSVFSKNARGVELCLFDLNDLSQQVASYQLSSDISGRWSVEVPSSFIDAAYGYRVDGEFNPEAGNIFNKNKLLFDPYATAVARLGRYHQSMHSIQEVDGNYLIDDSDSTEFAPLAAVVPEIGRSLNNYPRHGFADLFIYELHVKGMTMLNPLIEQPLRGTYKGLCQPAVIQHLSKLGITAVELMPVHFHFDEPHLAKKDLNNYWGYSTLGYFAPDPRYAYSKSPLGVLKEFQAMVNCFHQAGIEVYLDVVYNHSCEGGVDGPTLSFRGFDNSTYYRLDEENADRYVDYTGCGNSFNTMQPEVCSLILDSLRYWVETMGVDGFRFDLATVLARGAKKMEQEHGFFAEVASDPILANVKLFAEPWDIETFELGNFPSNWAEWNGKYRDTVRSYWGNEAHTAASFATRLAGSSDLFVKKNLQAQAGINFITCHDGFTLLDLVSFKRKHNLANGEENQDGSNHNRSKNFGVEGSTNDLEILKLRKQQQKNFLLTLFLSVGTPMILGGDELSRTQLGNNNAYCQDNEVSWIDWSALSTNRDLTDFCARLVAIRKSNPTFRRRTFFKGENIDGGYDIRWFLPEGSEIVSEQWIQDIRALAVLYGSGTVNLGDVEVNQENKLYLMLNPTDVSIEFKFPTLNESVDWRILLATSLDSPLISDEAVALERNSALLLSSA